MAASWPTSGRRDAIQAHRRNGHRLQSPSQPIHPAGEITPTKPRSELASQRSIVTSDRLGPHVITGIPTACAVALSLCACLAACGGGRATGVAQPAPARVLVFGIDGGTWDVVEPLMREGQLPNLKRLYDRGVHGVLESRPPMASPVVWTTIFTGLKPAEHGVRGWATAVSTNRRVAALWNITSARGLATDVLNVPGSWPPDPVDGVMIAGFPLGESTVGGGTGMVVSEDGLKARDMPEVFRAGAAAILRTAAPLTAGAWSDWIELPVPDYPSQQCMTRVRRLDAREIYVSPCYRIDGSVDFASPAAALERVRTATGMRYVPEGAGWLQHARRPTLGFLFEHLVQIARIQSGAAAVFAADPWRLFVYVNTLVDRVSHPYWPYTQPQDYDGVESAKARRHAETVRDAYREVDRELGAVLAAAKGDYDVVVLSDHGFQSNGDRHILTGRHHPDGIYLISSARMRAQPGQRAHIEDVTPTVLYMLGLPIGRDMAGRVLPEVAAELGRPIESVASLEGEARRGIQSTVDEKTWEQLKALGYVGGAAPRAKDGRRR